ncbi:MAG: hypothetical protein JXB35_16150 [Anaerolineae bacterium]|nr:hypothetical protein [Anaerolineae bacterium]
MLRRMVRETAFNLARRDVADFLHDHEDDLMCIFREEMQRLDDDLPEEQLFIDIKIVPLGEVVMKAVLRALHRFLTEDAEATAPEEEEPEASGGALGELR